MMVIGVNSLGIPIMPSLVHMPDLKRTGEVAGRSLCPCFPQVDADAMVPRDNRGETLATIKVGKCRWWADGGRA